MCGGCSLPGFSGSEDCIALEQLLQGYDQQDEDQVNRVCTSPLFKYMDNDVRMCVCLCVCASTYFEVICVCVLNELLSKMLHSLCVTLLMSPPP